MNIAIQAVISNRRNKYIIPPILGGNTAILSERLAYPTAVGYGKDTVGGRGGYVYHVTSLADTNTNGTFRYGIETLTGKRTIVFDVSGTIEMTNYIKIRDGFGEVTILGQTAPAGGIHLAKAPFWIHDSQIIMRHMTHRLGKAWTNNDAPNYQGTPADPNYEPDASFRIRAFGSPINNFMFDHLSLYWGHDGTFAVGDGGGVNYASNITIQNSIVAETLDKKYGALILSPTVTMYENLWTQGQSRTPSFLKPYITGEFINNIVYNGRSNHSIEYSAKMDFISNVYKYGSTVKEGHTFGIEGGNGGTLLDTEIYLDDNISVTSGEAITFSSNILNNPSILKNSVVASTGISVIVPSTQVENKILPTVGSYLNRDAADTRVVNDYINDTGDLLETETTVGGFPSITSVTRPAGFYNSLTDIPETFVQAHGITSNDQVITNWNFGSYNVVNTAGYTAFEMYTFWLADDFQKLPMISSPSEADMILTSKKAFPSAEGYGQNASGGRGGDVYHVTTLADGDTPGTFRYGVERQDNYFGNRTIVFDVGGDIKLDTDLSIGIGNYNSDPAINDQRGKLTIAGETAPSPGITLTTSGPSTPGISALLRIRAANVIVRYITSRVNDGDTTSMDCINIINEWAHLNNNSGQTYMLDDIILDHVSMSHGDDENFSVQGAENVTVQNSMLNRTNHSYNFLFGHSNYNFSFTGNYLSHSDQRNVLWGYGFADESVEMINNLIYGYNEGNFIAYGHVIDVIGNVYNAFPDDAPNTNTISWRENSINNPGAVATEGRLHVADNHLISALGGNLYNSDAVTYNNATRGMTDSLITSWETTEAGIVNRVLGGKLPGNSLYQDNMDAALIADYENQTGNLYTIDPTSKTSTSRAGNYYSTLTNIPESFVQEHNITSENEIKSTWDFDGFIVSNDAEYTAFEMYLFFMAGEFNN